MDLIGVSNTDPAEVVKYYEDDVARPHAFSQYILSLFTYCSHHKLNFDALLVQSMYETAEGGRPWQSYWWYNRLNPAGIGGREIINISFYSGSEAAKAHFVHMYLCVFGSDLPPGFFETDDPWWKDSVKNGIAGYARTTDDLQGLWSKSEDYAHRLNTWEGFYLRSGIQR